MGLCDRFILSNRLDILHNGLRYKMEQRYGPASTFMPYKVNYRKPLHDKVVVWRLFIYICRLLNNPCCQLEIAMKHILIFVYLILFCIGVIAISLQKGAKEHFHKEIDHYNYSAFLISYFAHTLCVFVLFYRDLFINNEGFNLLTVIGYNLSITIMLYVWFHYVAEQQEKRLGSWSSILIAVSLLYNVCWIVMMLFFMDKHYHINNRIPGIVFCVSELVYYGIVITLFLLLGKKQLLIEKATKQNRIAIILVAVPHVSLFLYAVYMLFWDLNLGIFQITFVLKTFPFSPLIVIYLMNNIMWFAIFQGKKVENELEDKGKVQEVVIDSILDERYHLTVREIELAMLLSNGYSNTQIAEELFISRNTVKNHIANIFRKLEIKNRYEAIALLKELKK